MTSGAAGPDSNGLDASKPNIARLYDYLLGGKDNFAADRALGDQIKQALPEIYIGVQAQRAVLRRAVRHLVAEAGIRQLVDVGSGLPTAGNVHEVAQAIDPEVRVAYVDNDPIVLSHARALLASNDATVAVEGDLHRPESIIEHPTVRSFIDFGAPVGLLLCGILHHMGDDEDPWAIVARLVDAVPAGSYLFVHHLLETGDPDAAQAQAALRQGLGRGQFRPLAEVERLFTGLDLVEPGVVHVPDWRPDPDTPSMATHPVLRLAAAGVARKP
jgi:hypothetical protein